MIFCIILEREEETTNVHESSKDYENAHLILKVSEDFSIKL
jgi:hypothetical protein